MLSHFAYREYSAFDEALERLVLEQVIRDKHLLADLIEHLILRESQDRDSLKHGTVKSLAFMPVFFSTVIVTEQR